MKILICGDSYSDNRCIINGHIPNNTWIDQLGQIYDVQCMGEGGASNEEVYKQLLSADVWDFALVSLTPSSRGRFSGKFALKLIKTRNVYCWSPFITYRNIKGVDWQPFVLHNEMFIKQLHENEYYQGNYTFTGCHFTREGNKTVFEHMRFIIEHMLGRSDERWLIK